MTHRGTTRPAWRPLRFIFVVALVVAGALTALAPIPVANADPTSAVPAASPESAVWGWGWNGSGAVGDGGALDARATPSELSSPTNIVAIAAGNDYSLALDSGGAVWAWGWNLYGQLGTGAVSQMETTPLQLSSPTNIVAIAAGTNHSMALDGDGHIWAWGFNGEGQLGVGGACVAEICPTPLQLTTPTNVVAIAVGDGHNLALDDQGHIWAWGSHLRGQLGIGATAPDTCGFYSRPCAKTPIQIAGATIFTAIAAGAQNSLAIDNQARVWSWGSDDLGALGNGSGAPDNCGDGGACAQSPILLASPINVTAVSAGFYWSLVLDDQGRVWTWGYDITGNSTGPGGSEPHRHDPVQLAAPIDIVAISAAYIHAHALDNQGRIWSWGIVRSQELGAGPNAAPDTCRTNPCAVSPVQALAPPAVAISGGVSHVLALVPLVPASPGPSPTPAPSSSSSPAPSPSSSPVTVTLTVQTDGAGTVQATPTPLSSSGTPSNMTYVYPAGTEVNLGVAPGGGQVFIRWAIDGAGDPPYGRGWASPMTITLDTNHAAKAFFVPRPNFSDVSTNSPAYGAITELTARDIIKGYTLPGCTRLSTPVPCFGPGDPTQRAQTAAFLVRLLGMGNEVHEQPGYGDLTGLDPELQRAVATMVAHGIFYGYSSEEFGPFDRITYLQTALVISRSFVFKGYWTRAALDDPTLYPNLALGPNERLDLVTFVQNAGLLPGIGNAAVRSAVDLPAPREWTAQVVWLALNGYFGVDQPGKGGFVP